MNERVSLLDLAALLSQKYAVNRKEAETFIRALFDLIEETLEREQSVKVKGLGSFKLVAVDDRESVNINTGERFEIQGYTKVSFTPEPALRDLINKPFAHFETVVLNDSTTFDDLPEPDASATTPTEAEEGEEEAEETLNETFTHAPEHRPSRVHKVLAASGALLRGEEEAEAAAPNEEAKTPVEDEAPAEDEAPSDGEAPSETEVPSETETNPIEEIPSKAEEPSETSVVEESIPIAETPIVENKVEDSTSAKEESSEVESRTEEEKPSVEETPSDDEGKVETVSSSEAEESSSASSETTATPKKKIKKSTWIIGIVLFLLIADGIVFWYLYGGSKEKERLAAEAEMQLAMQRAQFLADSLRQDSIRRDSLQRDSLWLAAHAGDSIQLDTILVDDAPKEALKEAPQPAKPQEAKTAVAAQSATAVQSATTAQPAKPAAQPATNETYSLQTKYEAVGTLTTHAIAPGETLRKIALKYYGHKEFSNYIVNYNAAVIKDPNQVPVGTVLNIPRLKAK